MAESYLRVLADVLDGPFQRQYRFHGDLLRDLSAKFPGLKGLANFGGTLELSASEDKAAEVLEWLRNQDFLTNVRLG